LGSGLGVGVGLERHECARSIASTARHRETIEGEALAHAEANGRYEAGED
jgi:hypothetical protein